MPQDIADLRGTKLPPGIPTWPTWLVVPLCVLIMGGTMALDIIHPTSVAGGMPYIAVVLIASFATEIWVTFAAGTLSIVLIIVGFQMSPAPDPTIAILNRIQTVALVALLGGAFIYRIRVMKQRDKATQELSETIYRLKVLQGVLPICSCCKKIKTDLGEWHQLETYIQKHSEAEFTHGICNECARKHYGEFWSEEDEAAVEREEAKSAPAPDQKEP